MFGLLEMILGKKPEAKKIEPGPTNINPTGKVLSLTPSPYGVENDPMMSAMHQQSIAITQENLRRVGGAKTLAATPETQTPSSGQTSVTQDKIV